MSYQIWDLVSKNLVDTFGTEREALLSVGAAVRAHGGGYVDGLLLVSEDRRGITRTIAAGDGLLRRAEAAAVNDAVVGDSVAHHV